MVTKDINSFVEEIKTVLILEHRLIDHVRALQLLDKSKKLKAIKLHEQHLITNLHKLVAECGLTHDIR